MNRNVRRLLALALLVVPLLFPAAAPKAREGATQPNTEMVRAVRRVNRARVSRDQADFIRVFGPLQGVVNVQGRLIRPFDGTAIWQLTNGSYGIFSPEPTPQAMEVWTKDLGEGFLYFVVCYCPENDPNQDDGCRFNPPGNPAGQCGGPNACCTKVEGYIDNNGIPEIFGRR